MSEFPGDAGDEIGDDVRDHRNQKVARQDNAVAQQHSHGGGPDDVGPLIAAAHV